jgi:hypothetical protein
MSSHLFQSLPIGALFFRDPFNPNENPSIKVDDDHARNPKGEVIEVNGGVLVFAGSHVIVKQPIAILVEA